MIFALTLSRTVSPSSGKIRILPTSAFMWMLDYLDPLSLLHQCVSVGHSTLLHLFLVTFAMGLISLSLSPQPLAQEMEQPVMQRLYTSLVDKVSVQINGR